MHDPTLRAAPVAACRAARATLLRERPALRHRRAPLAVAGGATGPLVGAGGWGRGSGPAGCAGPAGWIGGRRRSTRGSTPGWTTARADPGTLAA